jgi:phenylalanyl-tRNA synthetase beta chain
MKINLEWIKDYVKADLPPAELVEKLTAIGLVAESVEDRDGDPVLDLETYANRPDTLGHRGVAREISAMLGLPFEDPVPPVAEFSRKHRAWSISRSWMKAFVRGIADWLSRA